MSRHNYSPLHQQTLAQCAGVPEQGRKICAPTAFLNVLQYIGHDTDPITFIKDLHAHPDANLACPEGWSRPALTQFVRTHEHVPTVSWRRDLRDGLSNGDITAMQKAGYVSDDPAEISYLLSPASRTLEEIVAERPAIVTVQPGFAKNVARHAIVLTHLDSRFAHIIDPDRRNSDTRYSTDHLYGHLSHDGAVSVVL